jgi:hypothetical protein
VICRASCARLAFSAACTFSAVGGSEWMRTPTASWMALRIAAAVRGHRPGTPRVRSSLAVVKTGINAQPPKYLPSNGWLLAASILTIT